MAAAVSPFLADHADQFSQELLTFSAARLSIKQYDRLVSGEVAEPVQTTMVPQAGQSASAFNLYSMQ